jgi:Gram-negative bacterial TonB protein C-terminal
MNLRIACNNYIRIAQLLALFALGAGATTSRAQQSTEPLPTVAAAGVPFYPPVARIAHIEGVVHLQLSTDGKRVSGISVEGGPPALVPAAEENVRSWQFKVHSPTTFEVTFLYKMLPESACEMDNGTVLLKLPTVVEVSAKGVQTCDPALEKKSR